MIIKTSWNPVLRTIFILQILKLRLPINFSVPLHVFKAQNTYSLFKFQLFHRLYPQCNPVSYCLKVKPISPLTCTLFRLGSTRLLPGSFHVFTLNPSVIVLKFSPEMTWLFTPLRLQNIRSARRTKLVSRNCYIRKRPARHTKVVSSDTYKYRYIYIYMSSHYK